MSDVKAVYGAKRNNTVLDIVSKKYDIELSALRQVIGDSMEAKPKYLHQSHLIVGGTKER